MATRNHTPTMTATQAVTFDRFSVANAVTVKTTLACGCEPYADVFTYNRWHALGYQVQRGQKAVKIPVIIHRTDEETEEDRKLFRTASVFCRCQVAPIGATPPTPEAKPIQSPATTTFTAKTMATWRTI